MKLTQKAEQFLDMPDGSLTGEARLEIDGRRRLTVEGACDILEYEDSMVRLHTLSGEVRVTGDRLMLDCLHQTGVCLSGRLLSVEFL